MAGKGDRYRPVNRKNWEKAWAGYEKRKGKNGENTKKS